MPRIEGNAHVTVYASIPRRSRKTRRLPLLPTLAVLSAAVIPSIPGTGFNFTESATITSPPPFAVVDSTTLDVTGSLETDNENRTEILVQLERLSDEQRSVETSELINGEFSAQFADLAPGIYQVFTGVESANEDPHFVIVPRYIENFDAGDGNWSLAT